MKRVHLKINILFFKIFILEINILFISISKQKIRTLFETFDLSLYRAQYKSIKGVKHGVKVHVIVNGKMFVGLSRSLQDFKQSFDILLPLVRYDSCVYFTYPNK